MENNNEVFLRVTNHTGQAEKNLLGTAGKLYEDRKDFAHCYRSDLLLRGNQTNNFVESQFLVVKDILKRTKEYNVVALFMKLTTELENHSKEKLLSIPDGSFEGHFRRRFMGKGKTKNDVQGYKQPNEKERNIFTKCEEVCK